MDYRPAVILCVDASGSTDRSSRELIDAAIAAQNGKRIESPDYGVLAEFALAAVAIRAAQDAHDAVSERNAGLRRNRRTVLRVGVHIGEVTVDGDELQGEGVDVARRLAGIAEPGGIAISEATHNQVQGRVKLPFKRLEDRAIDTHGGPVRVWHWQSADPGAAAKQAPSFIAKAVALLDPEKSAVKRDRETQREIARDVDDSMAAEASRSGGREATSQIKATETAPKDEAEKPLDRGAVQRKPKPTDPEYRYNALLLWSLVLLIGALVTWYYVTQESADPRVSAREDIEDPSGFLRTAPSDRPIQGDRTSLGGTASSGRVAEPGGDALPKPSRSVIDDYNLPQLTIAPRAGESSKLAAEQYGGGGGIRREPDTDWWLSLFAKTTFGSCEGDKETASRNDRRQNYGTHPCVGR